MFAEPVEGVAGAVAVVLGDCVEVSSLLRATLEVPGNWVSRRR
jgi:hypothetical protein